jgi:uridine kinase
MGEIIITIDGEKKKYESGTTYEQIIQEYQGMYENQIALVSESGKLRELYRKAKDGAEVKFVTFAQSGGHKTYERSAILLTMKAIDDVLGHDRSKQFKVEFAIGNGLFIRPLFDMDIDDAFIEKLKIRMK